MTLRIVTYNIRKGGRPRQLLIAEVLGQLDADIVVLEEAVDPWVVGELARGLHARIILAAPGRSVAVLSRIGPLDAGWGPGAHTVRYTETQLPSHGMRLIGLHLTAGLSSRGERRRSRELEHVLAAARRGAGQDGVIIAGDLNAVAPGDAPPVHQLPRWIRILLRIDGGISTRVMERAVTEGLTDAYRHLHPDMLGATIPAIAPVLRLDYFLLGADVVPRLRRCEVPVLDPTLLGAASDHLPLLLELDSPAGSAGPVPATDPQRAPVGDASDRKGGRGTMAP